MPFAGMLVDLDDTILAFDTVAEPAWAQVCAKHAAALGCDPTALHATIREAARRFWNDPDRHRRGRLDLLLARREIVGAALHGWGMAAGAADGIAEDYTVVRDALVHPLPGALAALDHWRQIGVRLALVTNGAAASQRQKIDRFDLAQYFDIILVEGECGFGKPDRRIFERAQHGLALDVGQVCMVGDSLEFDIVGANGCGLYSIWIDAAARGLPQHSPARPDRVVRSLRCLVHEPPPPLA